MDEYLRLRAAHASATGAAQAPTLGTGPDELSGAELRAAQKEVSALERRLEKLQEQIDRSRTAMADHDQSDFEGLAVKVAAIRALEDEVTEVEERWFELGEQIG